MKGPVVLLGPSGAGKTTAGARAAAALGMRFVDLDAVIGDPARVFRDEGEASFRVREHAALDAALDGSDVVIAAGAGVVDVPLCRELLRTRATCVALDVDGATATQRLRASPRPWLPHDDALDGTALKVWTKRDAPRRKHREELTFRVPPIDARASLDDVVRELARAIDALRPVRPTTPAATFVDDVTDALAAAKGDERALVVADARVARLHRMKADVLVDGGEQLKSLARIEELAAALVERGATRDTLVVAVGGGALLDAAGFVAALLFRGVRWAAVPTTLLAQADASIGGKTGVSLTLREPSYAEAIEGSGPRRARGAPPARGKNLLGAFHAPARTVVCTSFIDTLDEADVRGGRAEMLKHELLAADVPADGTPLSAGTLVDEVRRSLALKTSVVQRDPRERGLRAVLNLGHTLAHALEATTSISHGEAVRHGLLRMLELSVAHAGLDARVARTLEERVRAIGPLAKPDVDARAIEGALRVDKKGAGRWVLLRAPGLPVVRVLDAMARTS